MSRVKEALSKWGTRIQQVSKVVDDVEAKLDCRRKEERQEWRHIPVLATLEFTLANPVYSTNWPAPGALQMQEQNWLNGGEDVHLQGVMTSVYLPYGGATQVILNTMKTAGGFGIRGYSEGDSTIHYVDFGWNIRVGRTGQYLLSPSNNGQLLGSTTLRKDRAGKVQWFSSSLRVPAGENILVQMKPLRLPLSSDDVTFVVQNIRVSMTLFGTRTGGRFNG
jgi:hypothetical protein